ncbi:hypothetical protein KI387_012688, partial [Taxus chinensis]
TQDDEFKVIMDDLLSNFDSSSDVEMLNDEMETVEESNSLLDSIMDEKIEEFNFFLETKENEEFEHNLSEELTPPFSPKEHNVDHH